jgi:hypothetical protein
MRSEGILGVNTEMMVFWTVMLRRMLDSIDISEEAAVMNLKGATRILRNFECLFFILRDVTSTMTILSN